ncbi:F-box/kelch-repeat protein At1g57790-like [Carex rostrata]
MASWSDLASDVLEHITSFLHLPDHHRVSAVCRNWRCVVKRRRCRPAPELPWLVLGEDDSTKKRKFYNLSEKKHYSIDIPQLYGRFISSSSYGWLFAVDTKLTGIMINPFTRDFYDLPPFPPYNEYVDDMYNTESGIMSFINPMQTQILRKAVLSHDPRKRSDFTVMIMFGGPIKVAIWRPGDTAWTRVKFDGTIFDIICFKEKFYAVSCNNFLYSMEVVGSDPKISSLELQVPMNEAPDSLYLVDFNGKLLLVMRNQANNSTKEFIVCRINLHKKTWSEWIDVRDHALFVGNNSAIVVDASQFTGTCLKNGIYFTDLFESYHWLGKGHDLGIYDYVNETFQCYYEDQHFLSLEEPLVWYG